MSLERFTEVLRDALNKLMYKRRWGLMTVAFGCQRTKSTTSPTFIYYYFNYNKDQVFFAGGVVITAILEASKGDTTFVPPSPEVTCLDGLYITNF